MGLPLTNKRPCSVFTAQPKLIKEEKWKVTKSKTKVHLSGYTQGQHMWTSATRDIIEKWKEEQYLQAGSTRPTWLLCGSVQSRLGSGGRFESSSWRGGKKSVEGGRRVGWGEVERERRTKSTPPFTRLFHLFIMLWKKEGVNVKVKSNSLKYLLIVELLKKTTKTTYKQSSHMSPLYANAFSDNVFKLVLRFFFFFFGSSVAVYVSSSPLRLCSFSFPLFFSLSSLPFTKNHTVAGFPSISLSLSL